VLTFGLASGACSVSYQLGSLFGKDDDAVKHTGSILEPKAKAEQQADSDLDYARAAAAEVLDLGRKDASLPWENPKSGARGTVTPIATAYSLDGLECRDFLASYVREGAQAWLRGEACRKQQGRWEVRSLKPWKRS
jgi:surface antigen